LLTELQLSTDDKGNGISSYATVLHEMMHVVTIEAISKDAKVKAEAERLYRIATRESSLEDVRTTYGLSDVYEFVAEGLSSENFKNSLSKMTDPDSPKQTLMDRFVKLVRQAIGLDTKDATVLDSLNKLIAVNTKVFNHSQFDTGTVFAKGKVPFKTRAGATAARKRQDDPDSWKVTSDPTGGFVLKSIVTSNFDLNDSITSTSPPPKPPVTSQSSGSFQLKAKPANQGSIAINWGSQRGNFVRPDNLRPLEDAGYKITQLDPNDDRKGYKIIDTEGNTYLVTSKGVTENKTQNKDRIVSVRRNGRLIKSLGGNKRFTIPSPTTRMRVDLGDLEFRDRVHDIAERNGVSSSDVISKSLTECPKFTLSLSH